MTSAKDKQIANVNPFLRSWAWKREHRPDRDRFHRPYIHPLNIDGLQLELVIKQARFSSRGFASTVWDSAIVLSKYLEKCPSTVHRKKCIELGSGCGLPGIVAAHLGASSVLSTDLSENLTLLKENVLNNNISDIVSIVPLEWGKQNDMNGVGKFDVVLAADVMYDACVISAFVETLRALSNSSTKIFLSYGRNRQAEDHFLKEVQKWFSVQQIENEDLDEVYQCIDVDVFLLTPC